MIRLSGESRYVNVDGIETHYVAAGEGPPLLLFHGLGASVITWRDNFDALAERFKVYAIDLPGHGDTDKPDYSYDPYDMIDYIASLVKTLELERPAMIGNSIGGGVALMLALRQPDLVSSLVLVDSAALGKEISVYIRLASLPLVGSIIESSKVGGTRFMLQNVFHDQSFATQDLAQELYRSRQMPGAKEAVVRVLRQTVNLWGVRSRFIFVDELKNLKMPLMVVWGAQDRILPVSHAYRAAEAAPDTRLEIFDECGHWPHMEKSKDFNSLALDFLSGR